MTHEPCLAPATALTRQLRNVHAHPRGVRLRRPERPLSCFISILCNFDPSLVLSIVECIIAYVSPLRDPVLSAVSQNSQNKNISKTKKKKSAREICGDYTLTVYSVLDLYSISERDSHEGGGGGVGARASASYRKVPWPWALGFVVYLKTSSLLPLLHVSYEHRFRV